MQQTYSHAIGLGVWVCTEGFQHISLTLADLTRSLGDQSAFFRVLGADDHQNPNPAVVEDGIYFGPPGRDYWAKYFRCFPYKYVSMQCYQWEGGSGDRPGDGLKLHVRAVDFDAEDLEEAVKYLRMMLSYRPATMNAAPHDNALYNDAEEFLERLSVPLANLETVRKAEQFGGV